MTIPRLASTALLAVLSFAGTAAPAAMVAHGQLDWHTDYAEASARAQALGKLLLVRFVDPAASTIGVAFEQQVLANPQLADRLAGYVRVQVPLSAEIIVAGQPVRLLAHPAYVEMLGRAGLAVVDYRSAGSPLYGRVVSVIPFAPGRTISTRQMQALLDLPTGTLTQRTMIYAVRIHPEGPSSTRGVFHPVLADEAQSHSDYQATIRNQGHHRWGHRFQRILGRLRGANDAREVVAESWPGQSLVDAAVECVDSWRHSSGHWQAVRSNHAGFAYDIKRGVNGIWYATGIFTEGRVGG